VATPEQGCGGILHSHLLSLSREKRKATSNKNSLRTEMIEKYSVPKKIWNGRPKRSEG
jgi:hypothetical protein